MLMGQQYWFKSNKFKIVTDEDDVTNPGRYGRDLAFWLEDELKKKGYENVTVSPYDWGWCILMKMHDVELCVACGSVMQDENDDGWADLASHPEQITWTCYGFGKPSILSLFAADLEDELALLDTHLSEILTSDSAIVFAEQP